MIVCHSFLQSSIVVFSLLTHSSEFRGRIVNIVNSTDCLTATTLVERVVVGGWKSHVFLIQIWQSQKQRIQTWTGV